MNQFYDLKNLHLISNSGLKYLKTSEKGFKYFAFSLAYVKRVIAHPSFKNVTFKDAEKLLEAMDQGECIVRPSSKV